MARVRHLQGPNLKNPYSGWDMFANNVARTSQNVLNRHERADVRTENNAFRDKSFDNTVKNQDRNYELNLDKFNESVNQNQSNNNYRDMYFGYKKDIDNRDFLYKKGRDEVKDNQWSNQFDFNTMNANRNYNHKVEQSNKANYTTFNGVDAEGNPVLSVFNKNDGTTHNTNTPIYQKPKEMTPYQEENLLLRQEAAKAKEKANQLKVIETLSVADGWDDLTSEGQQQMIDYYNKTGLVAKINNPWGWGQETPIIPLSNEQKKIKENQLAEDMKILMQ